MDSYLFAPSHLKPRLWHRGRRWCRWPLTQSGKLVSEDRTDSIWLNTHVKAEANSCKYCLILLKGLTVSSSVTSLGTSLLFKFVLSMTSVSLGQFEAPPTICPWIAVPRTVPSTSTIIPESSTEMDQQCINNNSNTHKTIWSHQSTDVR